MVRNRIAISSFVTLVSLLISVNSPLAFAHEGHDEAVKMPKDFEMLKKLAGNWESTQKTEKGEEKTDVTYELSAGGSIVIEKLSVGTSHEMVTVYHADGDKVAMTHYCMLGNHPTMTLKKVEGKVLTFEYSGGLKSKMEPHMHTLMITLVDEDHIQQEWVMNDKGKKVHTVNLSLTRKS